MGGGDRELPKGSRSASLAHTEKIREPVANYVEVGAMPQRHLWPTEPMLTSRSSMDLILRLRSLGVKGPKVKVCTVGSMAGRSERNTGLRIRRSIPTLALSYSNSLGMGRVLVNLDCQLDYIWS